MKNQSFVRLKNPNDLLWKENFRLFFGARFQIMSCLTDIFILLDYMVDRPDHSPKVEIERTGKNPIVMISAAILNSPSTSIQTNPVQS
jgi:hypothetical protein